MRRSLRFASLGFCLVFGSFGFAQTCERTDILVQRGSIYPGSINNYGTVVGAFSPGSVSAPMGFRWNNGVFNTYQYPGATATQFAGSNDKGQIVGSYGSHGLQHGLMFENGAFTRMDYPGAADRADRDQQRRRHRGLLRNRGRRRESCIPEARL